MLVRVCQPVRGLTVGWDVEEEPLGTAELWGQWGSEAGDAGATEGKKVKADNSGLGFHLDGRDGQGSQLGSL